MGDGIGIFRQIFNSFKSTAGAGQRLSTCMLPPPGEAAPLSRPFGRQLPRRGSHGGVAPCPRPAVGEGLAPPVLRALPRRRKFKETLIKSRCSDLRQKFSLARKKSAGILCVFQTFLTKTSGDLCREDGRGDLFRGSLAHQGAYDDRHSGKPTCKIL